MESKEDHHCAWRVEAMELRALLQDVRAHLSAVEAELAALKRATYGKKSERVSSGKVTEAPPKIEDPAATQRKRKERAQTKSALPKVRIDHKLPPDAACPNCGRKALQPMGSKISTIFECEPERVVQQQHVQETRVCICGSGVVTAEGPPKVIAQGRYGPVFIAQLVVNKSADSMPLYRQAQRYARMGIPIGRSTLTDLYHLAARTLRPLHALLVASVKKHDLVQADETPISVLQKGKCRRAYMWTFVTSDSVVYQFSATRAGETPVRVLGKAVSGNKYLIVDGYTGYNSVSAVEGWKRCGCNAHARRKFYEAMATAPEAKEAVDIYREIWLVEAEAKASNKYGTPEHHALRQTRSKPAMDKLHAWMLERQKLHPPKTTLMGQAIRYAINAWSALTAFLADPRIPVDNNASERALRVVALFRKASLFLGHDVSGDNHAALMSLIATCVLHGRNPVEYLADVLVRVQDYPAARLAELLPQNWAPASVMAAAA